MPKVNQKGELCAAWCEADHASWSAYQGPRHNLAPSRPSGGPAGAAQAVRSPSRVTPEVLAYLSGGEHGKQSAYVFTESRDDANRLAALLDFAADARPQTVHDLAASIREASAEAWPEPTAEAS